MAPAIMLRTIIIIHLLVLARIFALAQGNYSIRHYSTENGLPSNGIKGLHWDEQAGFLWIATEAGVVRFNGASFKTYNKENLPDISSERMIFLGQNYNGVVHTVDQNKNVFQIRDNKLLFKKERYRDAKAASNIYLLLTTNNLEERHYNNSNPHDLSILFHRILPVNDSLCMVIRNWGVIAVDNQGQRKLNLSAEKTKFTTLFRSGESCFIVDSSLNVYALEPESGRVSIINVYDEYGMKISAPAGSLFYWQNGMKNALLFIKEDAWELNYEDGKIIARLIADNIPTDTYIRYAQYSAKDRRLFIGTESNGVFVITRNYVRTVKKENTGFTERNSYYGQIELPNGNILTNEGHVVGENMSARSVVPIPGGFTYSVFQIDTLLWYHTTDTTGTTLLCSYNERNRRTTVYEKIRPIGNMALAKSANRIYIVHAAGIGYITNDSIKHILFYQPTVNSTAYDLVEIQPGILLAATCEGMYRIDASTNTITKVQELEKNCVRAIWKSGEYIFLGTYGTGYYILKNGVIRQMPLDKNKYLQYTHCFLPDDHGYVWISTNRGLFKASLEELINAYENQTSKVYYHYFGKADGMSMTEMNGGCKPCAITLKNKTMSFPTMDGLSWVLPAKETPGLPSGNIFIDEIIIDNRITNIDSFNLSELSPKTNEIIFRLSFSEWSNKENISVEYSLNEDQWTAVETGGNSIVLQNLHPGDYHLRIRKANGFGHDNYSFVEFQFSIIRPWYNRWWTYVIAGIALGGIFILFYKLRTRHFIKAQERLERQISEKTRELQEKNEVLEKADLIKTRLISIISHDIVTPLRFVTVAGNKLLDKKSNLPEPLRDETLQEITNTAGELQLLSTNILNWIKYQNENRRLVKEDFNVAEVGDQVFSILRSFANQKKLELVNEIDRNLVIHQFCEPLKIVVYNLVSNAINFSEGGKIVLSSTVREGEVEIMVKDNGTGMTEEQILNIMSDEFIVSSANVDNRKGNGLGYLIIKDLVKMMEARIVIESKKGKGTIVGVYLPV